MGAQLNYIASAMEMPNVVVQLYPTMWALIRQSIVFLLY